MFLLKNVFPDVSLSLKIFKPLLHHFPFYFFIVNFCDGVSDYYFEILFSFSDCGVRFQPSSEVCFLSSCPSFRKPPAPCRLGLPHVWIASTQTGGSLPWSCIRKHCGVLIKLISGPHSWTFGSDPLRRWN